MAHTLFPTMFWAEVSGISSAGETAGRHASFNFSKVAFNLNVQCRHAHARAQYTSFTQRKPSVSCIQGAGYAQAPPLSPPPQAAPTLKLRVNPSPETTPVAHSSARQSSQKLLPMDLMNQTSPSSRPVNRQAASQTAAASSQPLQQQQQQQQQQLDSGAATAQQEDPEQSQSGKRPNDSHLQLEQQQQQQPPGPKLKKQKKEASQGEQAQLSGGRPSLKVKLGGSSLKVRCRCKTRFYTHADILLSVHSTSVSPFLFACLFV